MLREDLKRYVYALDISERNGKKVESIDFKFLANDFEGELVAADFQVQEGNQVTTHLPNTSEMLLGVPFGIDEKYWMNTVSNAIKDGDSQPTTYTGLRKRFYNIVGRGHEAIALPNIYHEDYRQELLSSALTIKLTAKDDFDLVRISTNDGALVEDRVYEGIDHPLNYQYTREFYFSGGSAGDSLMLDATLFTATVNSEPIDFTQKRITNQLGETKLMPRQRLMLAPWGSFRLRVEFYKRVAVIEKDGNDKDVTRYYYQDTGIGYYGWAEFEQIKGRAKF